MLLHLSKGLNQLVFLDLLFEESDEEFVHLNNPLLSSANLYNMKAVFLVGASGVGKTTLTKTLAQQYIYLLRGQHVVTINLDCANPDTKTDIDICQLVTLEDIMEECDLG